MNRETIRTFCAALDEKWSRDQRYKIGFVVSMLVVLVLAPSFIGGFYVFFFTELFIFAVIAISYNFAFGFANIPSFGHAAFFGTGAYGIVLITAHSEGIPMVGNGLVVPVLLTLLLGTVFALFIGLFALRGVGLYFALITFGFAEVFHQLILRAGITRGMDGLIFSLPDVPLGIDLDSQTMFYITFLTVVLVTIIFSWLLGTPFGRSMRAIRANDDRARYVGYPVKRIKLVVFTISAFFTTSGGILFALTNRFINPAQASAEISIDLIIMTIIGGTSTLIGPLIGAVFYIMIEHFTRNYGNLDLIILGTFFITVMLFMSRGIYGTAKHKWNGFINKNEE